MSVVDNVTARKLADECMDLILTLTRESEQSPEVVRQVFLLLHQQLGELGNIETPKEEKPRNEMFAWQGHGEPKTDDDLMPFGKWKGHPLGRVPDDYWHWFLRQDWCDDWPDLVEYANVLIE